MDFYIPRTPPPPNSSPHSTVEVLYQFSPFARSTPCPHVETSFSYTSTCNHSSDPTHLSKVNRSDWEEMTQRLDNVELRLASIDNKLERLLEPPRAPYTPVVADTGIVESLEGRQVGRQVTSNIEEPSYPMLSLQERMKAQTSFPPFEVKLALIDLYFTHCHNNPYSLVHERQFRHNFHSGQLKNHLLLAVMASAARFADIAMLGRNPLEMAVYFADYAWQIASLDCFSGSMDTDIITVQTMALLALFDFTAGPERHNSAWVKIGLAVRLAQDLHIMEEPDATLPASEKEEHRRTFWSIYLLESLVLCGRYRPPAILDGTFLLKLPCNEQAWHSNVEERTPTLNDFCNHRIPENQNLGPFAMVIMAASLLSRCAQYALQKQPIGSDEPPWHPKSGHAAIVSSMMFLEEQL
ncbi:hypothetical protein N7532_002954 [Penicillium argentinense]|uniref:Xylanolytic transcriptional activator regulatory domain-containing protein n=1 Tax=Penicillium argentinense TaxID=1131581 RepID=A0A9W9KKP7_9EURO|nr:uncharacterized protein N7532_002954 [Penicillium argentinense]KAJ5110309.1 hypothetical protein N7532_002954 [Penicillium argentinense]